MMRWRLWRASVGLGGVERRVGALLAQDVDEQVDLARGEVDPHDVGGAQSDDLHDRSPSSCARVPRQAASMFTAR